MVRRGAGWMKPKIFLPVIGGFVVVTVTLRHWEVA